MPDMCLHDMSLIRRHVDTVHRLGVACCLHTYTRITVVSCSGMNPTSRCSFPQCLSVVVFYHPTHHVIFVLIDSAAKQRFLTLNTQLSASRGRANVFMKWELWGGIWEGRCIAHIPRMRVHEHFQNLTLKYVHSGQLSVPCTQEIENWTVSEIVHNCHQSSVTQ